MTHPNGLLSTLADLVFKCILNLKSGCFSTIRGYTKTPSHTGAFTGVNSFRGRGGGGAEGSDVRR